MISPSDFSPTKLLIGAIAFVAAFVICLLVWKAIERERHRRIGGAPESVEDRYRAVAQNIRRMEQDAKRRFSPKPPEDGRPAGRDDDPPTPPLT